MCVCVCVCTRYIVNRSAKLHSMHLFAQMFHDCLLTLFISLGGRGGKWSGEGEGEGGGE